MMGHTWKLCLLLIGVVFTGCTGQENDPCTWDIVPGYYDYCYLPDFNEGNCQNYVNYTLPSCKDPYNFFKMTDNYNYSLKINVKNPRQESLFLVDVQKFITLTLEDGDLTIIPEEVYEMTRLKEFTIFRNKISKVNFNKFLSMSSLIKIHLANNQITVIETNDVLISNTAVKDIDLSYNLIEVIPDNFVKPFSNLERLNLAHNKISSISLLAFEGIIHLETLDISNNLLFEVKNIFTKLIHLRELSLSNNHITNLHDPTFMHLERLEKLYINSNMIENISHRTFAGPKSLKTLEMSNNRVSKLGYAFAGLSDLQRLVLSNNNIITVLDSDYMKLSKLEVFDISFNNIGDIESESFNSLLELKVLDLRHNKIETIPEQMFNNNSHLTWLSLSDNRIEDIEPNSFKGKHINTFYIQNNKLTGPVKSGTFSGIDVPELDLSVGNITSIEDESFADMSHLNYLNLSTNAINKISYLAFSSLVSLNVLDLSYNQLQEVHFESETLRNLYKLYAHHNKIENIITNVFENFVSLQELDLSYNDIKAIEPHQFMNKLTYLDLSSNTRMKIIGDPFQSKTELNRLSLQNVKTDITFENSSVSVRVLELQSCGIIDINIVYIHNVQNVIHLNLSMNEIAAINLNSFKTMPSLVNLDLSLNKIAYIQPGSFLQTKALNVLNLYGNKLRSIQYGALDGLEVLSDLNLAKNELYRYVVRSKPVIVKLSLDDNYLTNFDFKTLFTTQTSKLTIGGNQLPCDVFEEMKHSNYSEKFSQIVTTKTLNFYTENINGISCQDGPNDNSIVPVMPYPASRNPLMTLLKSSLDQISKGLQTIGENTHNTEEALKDLIHSNNEKLTNVTNQLAVIKKFINDSEGDLDATIYLPATELADENKSLEDVRIELQKYNDQ